MRAPSLITFLLIPFLLLINNNISYASIDDPRKDKELRALLEQAVNDTTSFQGRFDAEVWLVDMSNRLKKRVTDPKKRLELLKLVHIEATRAGLEPELVLAVIQVESNFRKYAISRVGARGLMQIMPFWLDEIGHPDDDLFDVKTNLRFGCTILKHYLNKEKGNLTRALGRYNGSLGSYRYPKKVYKALDRHWF
ncbi:MAG: lytic transglycosylase domain-containing protein [Gammaproteobacteria bacterium]|nr:MAG: lytic transglycosylase domain-containing protein [Gammaproteobacteria bacterium]